MPNFRIVYKNVSDSANITASTTAGSLVAANMLNDIKGRVHRSVGLNVVYTLTWDTPQIINVVALPAHNISSSGTIRVTMYSDILATIKVADSSIKLASPGSMNMWKWFDTVNANTFAMGGANKTTVWFPNTYSNVKAIKIELTDANPLGYIDCARVLAGTYWEPKHNVQNGTLQIMPQDMSTTTRTDAGDLVSTRGVVFDRVSLSTVYLPEVDRASFQRILKQAARNFVLLSVFPDSGNSSLETDYTIYGKLLQTATTQPYYGMFDLPVEIESW